MPVSPTPFPEFHAEKMTQEVSLHEASWIHRCHEHQPLCLVVAKGHPDVFPSFPGDLGVVFFFFNESSCYGLKSGGWGSSGAVQSWGQV